LTDSNETEFSPQIFEKYSNTKFHVNLSSGSRVVACGRKDGGREGRTDGRTGMTKPIISSQFCERA